MGLLWKYNHERDIEDYDIVMPRSFEWTGSMDFPLPDPRMTGLLRK